MMYKILLQLKYRTLFCPYRVSDFRKVELGTRDIIRMTIIDVDTGLSYIIHNEFSKMGLKIRLDTGPETGRLRSHN
jgi:hypothetical protein